MEMSRHPVSAETDFHLARSRCIDSFARLEQAIIQLLEKGGVVKPTELFSQRVELSRKLKPSPYLSKARAELLPNLLNQCEAAACLRNDIAHAPLRIALIEGDKFACFVNPRQVASDSAVARLFSLEMLQTCADKWRKLAKEIDDLTKKPTPQPSPQQPSQGAAAGP
jgi:hypothetical protein